MGLDATIAGWLALAAAGIPAAQAVVAVRDAQRAASQLKSQWRAEHAVRLCGAVAAARRNVEDAARLLGAPAEGAAAAADASLVAAYPAASAPDATGRCHAEGGAVVAVLHREHNPAVPADWPNWVYRLEAP